MDLSSCSRRVITAVLALIILLAAASGAAAKETETENIVRVGWYESPFNRTDEFGRRSGYAYDYQQKIAAYSGWTYEYVEGSWPELLRMLADGRIDLLSDVSYTEERAGDMLFSALPMGAEEYYVFAAPDNSEITTEDYSTFKGKKVGANSGSIQIDCFREWAEANGVEAELIELSGTEEENILALRQGKIDMYVTLDGVCGKDQAVPICRVGDSDFYFAVSKKRPELLVELNNAMSRAKDENKYINDQLYQKYLQTSALSFFLSADENEWLSEHGPIRVGYQDNYLAFCARDPVTGELTGALSEYLTIAADCLENAHIDFEPVAFPTSAAAMEALGRGEVDCVFPANLTDYDGEMRGVFITPPLMRTDMAAVIRESERAEFTKKEHVTVAVNADNPNYDMFLIDHFPSWRPIYFSDTPECLKAISEGQADCLLISNYRFNNIAGLCEKYGLTTWFTGEEIDYCFAVAKGSTAVYSILTKTIAVVPSTTINASLTYYYAEDAKVSASEAYWVNAIIVLVILAAAAGAVAFAVLRWLRQYRDSGGKNLPVPLPEHFSLFDELPIAYGVFKVTHADHSELYDAIMIYCNRRYEEIEGRPAETMLGRSVRELHPHAGEEWFDYARRAAVDGECVEGDFIDTLRGINCHFTATRIIEPGYCAVTFM